MYLLQEDLARARLHRLHSDRFISSASERHHRDVGRFGLQAREHLEPALRAAGVVEQHDVHAARQPMCESLIEGRDRRQQREARQPGPLRVQQRVAHVAHAARLVRDQYDVRENCVHGVLA